MTHREMAEANFKEGYNCSQAVFAAFSEEVGLPRQTALQLASGFGGGVGRMREVCGAFSGAVMALGALYGSDDPAHKTAVYAMVQELAAKFKAETGSLICRELLGLDQPEGGPVWRWWAWRRTCWSSIWRSIRCPSGKQTPEGTFAGASTPDFRRLYFRRSGRLY